MNTDTPIATTLLETERETCKTGVLQAQDIERIDREFMRNQERDRMNERTQQIWPIFLSLSTAFGFIGLQNGQSAYLIGLFPVLVSCLAQHIHDSEATLKKNRKYLYQQEKDAGCTGGGEHFYRHLASPSKGGSKKALRKAFVISSLLATYLFIRLLEQNNVPLPYVLVALCMELIVTCQSFCWLTYWKPVIAWYQCQTKKLRHGGITSSEEQA